MIAGTHTARLLPKTKPKGRHPQKALSAAFVGSAPPGRHADGNGLYLFVQPSRTRSWIQRLLVRRPPAVSSDSAASPWSRWPRPGRRRSSTASSPARAGTRSPRSDRSQGIPHLRRSRRPCAGNRSGPDGATRGHPREWMSSLRRFAFPRIGKVPVSEVTSADVLEILTPVWHQQGPHSPAGCASACGRSLEMGRGDGVPH